VNPQKENSQTDKESENVGRGRGRARPLRSEVAVVVRKYERPSVTLRSALLKVSNSTASRIASFQFWGRDCLMRILISESARASIKCCFASVSHTFSGTG
jgi:hypothetical protein